MTGLFLCQTVSLPQNSSKIYAYLLNWNRTYLHSSHVDVRLFHIHPQIYHSFSDVKSKSSSQKCFIFSLAPPSFPFSNLSLNIRHASLPLTMANRCSPFSLRLNDIFRQAQGLQKVFCESIHAIQTHYPLV